MFQPKTAFSGFSVNDLEKARAFYTSTLELKVEDDGAGLRLHLPGGATVFAYAKDDHQPATFTILNFTVENIKQAVEALKSRGVQFEQYDFGEGAKTDEKGIFWGVTLDAGPNIAWFKDPAGNFLSVIEG